MNLGLKVADKGRHATWLELFYDLIYVVVIAKLAHILVAPYGDALTLAGFGKFFALFLPVWWAWTGHTMFANRFDPDDATHRVLTLLQMFGAVLMAIFITKAFDKYAVPFALSYVFVRGVLLIMYARVYVSNPELKSVSGRFLCGFSLGAGLWLISVFVPPPYRYALWALGLLVDFATPWISNRILSKVSVHASHLPERLGLLTIIVMGEAVLSVTTGLSDATWSLSAVIAAVSGFLLIASVWWLYFDALEQSLMGGEYKSGQLAIYGHLFVYLGLVTMAAGIQHAILPKIPAREIGWLISGGLLMFLIPLQFIHGLRITGRGRHYFISRNIILDAILVALAVYTPAIGASQTLVLIAVIYTIYVIIETRYGLMPVIHKQQETEQ